MPSRKELSPEDIREIVAARGQLTAKDIQKKFGIGTTRLYRIWREAGVVPGKTPKTAETAETAETTPAIPATPNNSQQPLQPPASKPAPATAETILLQQILPLVQEMRNDISILMETQESHYEDVEEIGEGLQGLEAEVEDTGEGILESIEKNSNALRAQTDKIVGTATAAGSAALGVVEVISITMGLVSVFLLLRPIVRSKLQQYAASEEGEQQNTASEERKQRNAEIEEMYKPPKQSKQPQQPVEQQKKGIRNME